MLAEFIETYMPLADDQVVEFRELVAEAPEYDEVKKLVSRIQLIDADQTLEQLLIAAIRIDSIDELTW